MIEFSFRIPQKYRPHLNTYTTLVPALRTSIGGTRPMAHPAGRDGSERWLGIRLRLQWVLNILHLEADEFITQKKVQIAPLDTLVSNRRVWHR